MIACLKFVFILLIAFVLIFLFLPKTVFSQVVINEFSPLTSTDDWVEIFNLSGNSVDLSEYLLVDAADNQKNFSSCFLISGGVFSVGWSNRLNNGGDRIILKKNEVLVDCLAYKDGPVCEGREIDLPDFSPASVIF